MKLRDGEERTYETLKTAISSNLKLKVKVFSTALPQIEKWMTTKNIHTRDEVLNKLKWKQQLTNIANGLGQKKIHYETISKIIDFFTLDSDEHRRRWTDHFYEPLCCIVKRKKPAKLWAVRQCDSSIHIHLIMFD